MVRNTIGSTCGSGRDALEEIFAENRARKETPPTSFMDELLEGQGSIEQQERFTEGSFTRKQLEVNTEANIRNMFNRKFYLTGSRAWGTNSEDSDWDYVVTPKEYNDLLNNFMKHNVTYNNHYVYKALYVADMYGMYNIICVSEFDYSCWQFATKAMKGLVREGAISSSFFRSKEKVYYAFEQFRCMYRALSIGDF